VTDDQWNSVLWTFDEDHPQRLMAQPNWRRRRWARGKTAADRQMHELVKNAPARFVKIYLHGLLRSPRTL
jgi:hypothetical protein